jgi:hypothetical protein
MTELSGPVRVEEEAYYGGITAAKKSDTLWLLEPYSLRLRSQQSGGQKSWPFA